MHFLNKIIFIFLFTALLSSCSKEINGAVYEYGTYQNNVPVISVKNPATFSGAVQATNDFPALIKQTDQIPLKLGTIFQFCFLISDVPKDRGMYEINLKIEHPEMIKPDNTKSTGFQFIKKHEVRDGTISTCTGYVLNHAYELVPGRWRFTYNQNNNIILQQNFYTYAI